MVTRVNGSTISGSGTTASAYNVTGAPACQAGDVLIITVDCNGTHATNGMSVSLAGETFFTISETQQGGASSRWIQTFYCVLSANQTPTPSVTPYASNTASTAVMDVFRGLSGTISRAVQIVSGASGTTANNPALGSAPPAGDLVLSLTGVSSGTATPPAAYTTGSQSSAGGPTVTNAYVLSADGSSTYGGTWTWGTANSSALQTVAFAAATAAAPNQGMAKSSNIHPGKGPGKARFMFDVSQHLAYTTPFGWIIAVGTALETDIAVRILKVPGIALETDIAMPIRPSRVRAIGTVTETDTAGTFGKVKTRTVGTVVETDSAITIGKKKTKAVGIVTETDTAIALGRRHTRLVGIVSETDTAIAIGKAKAKTVGIVTETDLAIAIGKKKTKAVGIVTEIDLALPIVKPLKGANTVTETDLAIAIGKKKTKAVGIVTETDSAITIGRTKTRLIGIVTETDLAIALGKRKTKLVGIVVETDIAGTFSKQKRRTVGIVVEIDLAQGIFRAPTVLEGMRVEMTGVGIFLRSPKGPALRVVNTGVAVSRVNTGPGTHSSTAGSPAGPGNVSRGTTGPALRRKVTGAGVRGTKGAGI